MTWMQQSGAFAAHALQASRALAPMPAQYLLSAIWQGSLLAAGAGLLLKAASRLSAGARFVVWAAVFVLVALLPLGAVPGAWPGAGLVAGVPLAGRPMLQIPSGWAVAIDAAWCLAAAVALSRIASELLRLRRVTKASWRPAPETVPEQVKPLLVSAAGRSGVDLRLSSRVESPCAVGLLHSAILVPEWLWARLGAEELRQIVLHEMAHLRRGDDWSNLLQKLLCALCPLNPALLWVERQLSSEREMACDEAVLEEASSPGSYAACLTGIAEARLQRERLELAPSAWRRPSELTRRVQGILDRRRRLGPLLSGGVVGLSLVLLLLAAGELARSPRIVSFTAPEGNAELAASARPVSSDRASLYRQAALRANGPAANRALGAQRPTPARLEEATFTYFRFSASARGAIRPRALSRAGMRPAAWRRQTAGREPRMFSRTVSYRSQRSSAWLVLAWPLPQMSVEAFFPAELMLAPQPQFLTLQTPTRWIVFKI